MTRWTERCGIAKEHVDTSGIKYDAKLFVCLGDEEDAACGFSKFVESDHSRMTGLMFSSSASHKDPAQHGGGQPLSGHEARSDATFQPAHEPHEEDNWRCRCVSTQHDVRRQASAEMAREERTHRRDCQREVGQHPGRHAPSCRKEGFEHEKVHVDSEWYARCKVRFWYEFQRHANHGNEPNFLGDAALSDIRQRHSRNKRRDQ